jgi:hypothetical protein
MVGVSTVLAAALHSCVGIGSVSILNQFFDIELNQVDDALTGTTPLRIGTWEGLQGMVITSIQT